ncbi:MAG TPA: nickel pincer cofactor biosynthesis protein LarC [Lentisphaeria bacterium]|nr:MAG: TIGR00299 family protein [Lentisphaerae bacterium GWF2_49_21]HBC86116.1 nickel pincer cofactor biosynthesis protein LarC [Lentisphaeria bacterium]
MKDRKILYIEPFSGAAGDMLVAALLGLGADCKRFWKGIASLPLKEKPEIKMAKVGRNGIAALNFKVILKEGHHDHHFHRTFADIEKIIRSAGKLSPAVKKRSIGIFRRLAEAEAKVHGSNVRHVHFHEVGAADAIIDIVGAVLCLEILKVDRIVSAPVALGSGTIRSAHGILPVPAPATVEIIKGCPTYSGAVACELTTPTGAVMLKSIVDEWGMPPAGAIVAVSCGAGTKDFKVQPNVLRVSIMKCPVPQSSGREKIAVLECNIDDMPGEAFSYVCPELLKMGALDYALIPVYMKKGRPGIILQVICRPEGIAKFAEFILGETSTIGVRYRLEDREFLRREAREYETPWGLVGAKLAFDRNGNMMKYKPDFESCARLAKTSGKGYLSISGKIRDHINKRVRI